MYTNEIWLRAIRTNLFNDLKAYNSFIKKIVSNKN